MEFGRQTDKLLCVPNPFSSFSSEFSTLELQFISQIDKISSSVIKSNKVELLSHMQKIEKKFLSKGSSESLESNSRDMINEFLCSTEFPHKTTGVNPSHFLHFLAQDGSFEATTNRDLDNYELSLLRCWCCGRCRLAHSPTIKYLLGSYLCFHRWL